MKTIQNTKTVTDSSTVIINAIAQQKRDAGITVFNLSAGEPKLAPHPIITNAVTEALTQEKTYYPPAGGIAELKKRVCEWMNSVYVCQFQAENCLVVNGGKFGIYLLLQLLLHKNDEVIIPSPYWVSYPAITKLFGGVTKIIETHEKDGWKLKPSDLEKACSSNSKILILNNACNPTGALYTKSELATLLKIAQERHLLVISDEVYSGLTYDDGSYISCGAFPEFKGSVVVIQSCSKNLAMTGWRVGFVLAPSNLIKQLTSLVSQSTSGVTTISQWAAVAAFSEYKIINTWVRQSMQQRRNALIQAFHDFFGISLNPPASSLYVFIALELLGVKNISCEKFCEYALEKANVALVPGVAFGKEGYIRLSFGATEADLRLGVAALAHFCKNFEIAS